MALALGFTACDNYELPNPPAQNNPQEAPVAVSDITVAALTGDDAPAVYDLKTYSDEGKLMPVGTIDVANWPADYRLDVAACFMLSEPVSGKAGISVPATVQEGVIYVNADDVETAWLNITKDPAQVTLTAEYAISAVAGGEGTSVMIGGMDYRFGNYPVTIKPFPADKVIESVYVLHFGDQEVDMANSGISPYDDPEFKAVVEIPADLAAAGCEWYVTPKSGNPVYGGALDSDALVEGAKGVTNLAGPVMVTVNMEALTYTLSSAYEFVYTPGNSNGWSQAASNALTTTDYMNYSGWAYLDGEWKFDATLDWGKPFGAGSEGGKLSTDPAAGNLNADPAGVYYLNMNIVDLTYNMCLMETCGIIGSATEMGWDGQVNLTQSAENPMIWTGKVKFLGEGQWKIRFNDIWDYNLGGDMGALTQGGADIETPGEGEKTVTVNLSTLPYSVTVE